MEGVLDSEPEIAEALDGYAGGQQQQVPWRAFLRNRPVLALGFTHFCNNWCAGPPAWGACLGAVRSCVQPPAAHVDWAPCRMVLEDAWRVAVRQALSHGADLRVIHGPLDRGLHALQSPVHGIAGLSSYAGPPALIHAPVCCLQPQLPLSIDRPQAPLVLGGLKLVCVAVKARAAGVDIPTCSTTVVTCQSHITPSLLLLGATLHPHHRLMPSWPFTCTRSSSTRHVPSPSHSTCP